MPIKLQLKALMYKKQMTIYVYLPIGNGVLVNV
jgi:hypothetical protein